MNLSVESILMFALVAYIFYYLIRNCCCNRVEAMTDTLLTSACNTGPCENQKCVYDNSCVTKGGLGCIENTGCKFCGGKYPSCDGKSKSKGKCVCSKKSEWEQDRCFDAWGTGKPFLPSVCSVKNKQKCGKGGAGGEKAPCKWIIDDDPSPSPSKSCPDVSKYPLLVDRMSVCYNYDKEKCKLQYLSDYDSYCVLEKYSSCDNLNPPLKINEMGKNVSTNKIDENKFKNLCEVYYPNTANRNLKCKYDNKLKKCVNA